MHLPQTGIPLVLTTTAIFGCGSNKRHQNGTLVSGNLDQHLRNPGFLILRHCHFWGGGANWAVQNGLGWPILIHNPQPEVPDAQLALLVATPRPNLSQRRQPQTAPLCADLGLPPKWEWAPVFACVSCVCFVLHNSKPPKGWGVFLFWGVLQTLDGSTLQGQGQMPLKWGCQNSTRTRLSPQSIPPTRLREKSEWHLQASARTKPPL